MISERQKRKLKWSKKKLMTKGGRGQYLVEYREFERLARIFADIKDIKKIRLLFNDLFTERELADIIRRLHIAQLLLDKKTYSEIQFITNTSRVTIDNVHQVLKSKGKGLRVAIDILRSKP
jgi:uncharacterized protein YerC